MLSENSEVYLAYISEKIFEFLHPFIAQNLLDRVIVDLRLY